MASEAATEKREKLRPGKSREEKRAAAPASEGVGPLFQRDYVVVLEETDCGPERVARMIRSEFPRFSPAELAEFTRPDGSTHPLEVGDTMHIFMTGAGHCAVRCVHVTPKSLTLRTLEGHVEVGRITFGATRDEAGRLALRIRSRARIDHPFRWVGYLLVGKHVQTRIWETFLQRVAEACGGRVIGGVAMSMEQVEEEPADRGEEDAPTFNVD